MGYPKQQAIDTCIAIFKDSDNNTAIEEWLAKFALHNIDSADVQKLMRQYKEDWMPDDGQ